MSAITQIPTGERGPEDRGKRFRPNAKVAPLPGVMERQTKLSVLAFGVFANRDDALQFLNEHSAELGGRPVDVAGASAGGLAAASAELEKLQSAKC